MGRLLLSAALSLNGSKTSYLSSKPVVIRLTAAQKPVLQYFAYVFETREGDFCIPILVARPRRRSLSNLRKKGLSNEARKRSFFAWHLLLKSNM